MSKRICIFCLQPGKVEAEHFWGLWIDRLFKANRASFTIQQLRPTAPQGWEPSKQWKDSKIGITAKLVCKKCNNTWMSDIEEKARSAIKDMILSDAAKMLGVEESRAMANFLFKTSVIADHMDSTRKPFFSPATRQRFSVSQVIPDGVQMWFSAFSAERPSGTFSTYYFKPTFRPLNRIDYYVFNFLIGHLLLQLVAKRWVKKHRRGDQLPVFDHEAARDVAKAFWPFVGDKISWPPPRRIGRQTLDDFSKRFSQFAIPSG